MSICSFYFLIKRNTLFSHFFTFSHYTIINFSTFCYYYFLYHLFLIYYLMIFFKGTYYEQIFILFVCIGYSFSTTLPNCNEQYCLFLNYFQCVDEPQFPVAFLQRVK